MLYVDMDFLWIFWGVDMHKSSEIVASYYH